MSQVSPPIRILLVCAVAFMAAWTLFLRPKAETGAPAESSKPAASAPVQPGGERAQSTSGKLAEKAKAAAAAHDAKAAQLAAAAADAPTAGSGSATRPSRAQGAAGTTSKQPADATVSTSLPQRVARGIADKRVVVLLFWSPRAAEDRAVRAALTRIDRHGGRVIVHAAVIDEIGAYQQITRGANVEQSPTVVIVDRNRKSETLVGYVDRETIDQAVTDALRNS